MGMQEKSVRLIDANSIDVGDISCFYGENCRLSDVQELINDQPTIDAVPVVRCGYCKHMMPDGMCDTFADGSIRPSVSDFCSYGEKRDE